MKRLLLVLFAFTIFFVACDKDDDSSNSGNFVGTWKKTTDTSTYYVFDGDGSYYVWHYESRKPKETLRGKWEYIEKGNGEFEGFLAFDILFINGQSQRSFDGKWVVASNGTFWISDESTEGSKNTKYVKAGEVIKTKQSETSSTTPNEPVYVEDEKSEIKLTLTTTKTSGNTYKCSVNVTGASSDEVEEIGIKFSATTSSDTPNLLFADPMNNKTSFSTTQTLVISEKLMGYAVINGKYYKSEIKTVNITEISKKVQE